MSTSIGIEIPILEPAGAIPVPGGGLPVEMAPVAPAPPAALAIPLDPTVMQVYEINRIHLELNGIFMESEVAKEVIKTTNQVQFATEEERVNWEKGIGGGFFPIVNRIVPPSYDQAYEKSKTESVRSGAGAGAGNETVTETVERGAIPITITVFAQLVGPEGVVWSQAFDMTIRWSGLGAPGSYVGTGSIDGYADLVNKLTVYTGQNYALRLKVGVPTSVPSHVMLGAGITNGVAGASPGTFRLFYDPQSRYPKPGE